MADRVTVHVEIDDAKLRAQTGPKLLRATNKFASDIRDEAKRTAPVRSGRLRASIRASRAKETTPGHFTGAVTAHAKHAVYVHEGTRPHIIRARRAKALRFYWPRAGRVVFFKHVNHPGTRPNPFLTRAARRVAARNR